MYNNVSKNIVSKNEYFKRRIKIKLRMREPISEAARSKKIKEEIKK